MLKFRNSVIRYGAVPVATGVMTVATAFPAFASSGGNDSGTLTGMLSIFTQVAAWLWSEVGLFCTFALGQPLLLLAFAIPFVGLIVNFFMRIFKTA